MIRTAGLIAVFIAMALSFQVGTVASVSGQQVIDQIHDVRSAPSVRWWYGVARFVSLAGAIGLLGGGWWLLQRDASPVSLRGPRRLLGVAWAAMLVASLAAFGLSGAEAVAGSLGDALDTSAWGDVAGTHTGRMLLLRVALVLVLGVLLALRERRAQGWWRGASLTAAVLALYTFSASGHANSLEPSALWIAVDVVHLGSIVVWIGGLLVLVVGGSPGVAGPAGERLVRRFSLAVSICVPLIVATGIAQTLKLAGGLDDITATDWGRLLLVKVTVVTALLAVAGVSRWLLHHDGASSTRRTLMTEAALGIVVVALSAGLVALPPAAAVAARPFAEQLSANGLIASVSLSPGSIGANEMHVEITPPGGSITPVSSATARVSLAAADIALSPVTLVKLGPNHYSGSVTFPQSGDWTIELVVQITATESVLLKTTASIP